MDELMTAGRGSQVDVEEVIVTANGTGSAAEPDPKKPAPDKGDEPKPDDPDIPWQGGPDDPDIPWQGGPDKH
jgi:hypothetical protein